jgi:ribonuclease VapC
VTVFVDASAIVAIMTGDPDASILIDRLADDEDRLSSPIAVWEATNALARRRRCEPLEAFGSVESFRQDMYIELVAIGRVEAGVAVDAFDRYGKGRHPAQLNMGDCFAYACARTNNARLLYKGDDFARTDLS